MTGNTNSMNITEREKVYLNADHIITGRPKKSLDWKRLGPFTIIKKVSPTAYKLQLPATWRMHPVFHISKLRRMKEDDFNRPVPKVTLNVRGENWAPEKVLALRKRNNLNEYLVQWKDQATSCDTWELESRMIRNGPEILSRYKREQRRRTSERSP